MSAKEFSVAFSGPAVDEGAMDVADLAPALLALGDLLRSANQVVNGDRATVKLQVKAEARVGSFEVDLQVIQGTLDQMRSALLGDGAIAAERLFSLIVGGGGIVSGLFGLIKWLGNRQPDSTTTLENGDVQITIGDQSQVFSQNVINIYNDRPTRYNASRSVAALKDRDGLERIEFKDDKHVLESINKADVGQFDPVETPSVEVSSSEREVALEVVTATFDGTRLWRVNDGSNVFNVGIEDHDFVSRIESGQVAFRKGDVLRVVMRTEQSIGPSGKLSTQHTIKTVVEKITAPQQIGFTFGNRDS